MAVREFKKRGSDLTILVRLKGADRAWVERQARERGCSGTEVLRRLVKEQAQGQEQREATA